MEGRREGGRCGNGKGRIFHSVFQELIRGGQTDGLHGFQDLGFLLNALGIHPGYGVEHVLLVELKTIQRRCGQIVKTEFRFSRGLGQEAGFGAGETKGGLGCPWTGEGASNGVERGSGWETKEAGISLSSKAG